MKVCVLAIPGDGDIVAAYFFSFIVEGLRDVAEEVDEEFHGLLAVCGREAFVVDTGGVVCDCGDDAAGRIAVAGKIDGARGWRRVFRIDEADATFVSERTVTMVPVKDFTDRAR